MFLTETFLEKNKFLPFFSMITVRNTTFTQKKPQSTIAEVKHSCIKRPEKRSNWWLVSNHKSEFSNTLANHYFLTLPVLVKPKLIHYFYLLHSKCIILTHALMNMYWVVTKRNYVNDSHLFAIQINVLLHWGPNMEQQKFELCSCASVWCCLSSKN